MGDPQQTRSARRARTTTRIAVGATLSVLEKAGELLDIVANRAELAALPPGSDRATPEQHEREAPFAAAVSARQPTRRQAVVLGAVFELEDRALLATTRTARAGTRLVDLGWRTGRAITPSPLLRRLERGIELLAERGRAEDDLSREEAADAINQLVEQASGGPWMLETANEVVGRILGPLLDNVLPMVVERLRENPEPIKELVRDQSVTLAGEVAGAVRSGAVAADSSLERVARRIAFRRPRSELPPSSS